MFAIADWRAELSLLCVFCGLPLAVMISGLWIAFKGTQRLTTPVQPVGVGPRPGRRIVSLAMVLIGFAIFLSPAIALWWSSSREYPAARSELRERIVVGISEDEVRSILGEPESKAKYADQTSKWIYPMDWMGGSYFGIDFDSMGRVERSHDWCQ
jgi:hypothetical protein